MEDAHIILALEKKEVMRYSEIKRELGKVTHKMLSTQLKELERDGLLIRREYPQVPPKVEYSLTEKGTIYYADFTKRFVNGDMNIYQRILK